MIRERREPTVNYKSQTEGRTPEIQVLGSSKLPARAKLSGWRKRKMCKDVVEVECTNESSKAVLKTQTQTWCFANVNQKKQLGHFPIRLLHTGRGQSFCTKYEQSRHHT
jgi:hypothetical protein